jgi:rifampicin phosphotransferase
MRVGPACAAAGIALRWRPFLLGPIFAAQGWTDSPFNVHPVKGRYMWRDLERICDDLGLPLRRPSRFPRNGLRCRGNKMTYILPFTSPGATLATVGGKGANLAELTRAHFDVPPGFLVTTDAYRAFVAANNLHAPLLALAKRVLSDDPVSLDEISAEIRALFERGTMPADVARAVDDAYLRLSEIGKQENGETGEGSFSTPTFPRSPAPFLPVAVRSSATAEDLPGLSFAGQQETYLNIVGADAVQRAVQECWSSLWTARALGYRARNGIAPDDVALAVVVQTMIMSDVSGVMFTSNPLTGRRDEVVIDASFGLGEAIVSGQVEPDHYVIRAQTSELSIITRKLGAKALTIVPRADGGTDTLTHAEANESRQALSDEQIDLLASIGRRIAQHYGSPQDIEWALANGAFYILQARPITSLYPLPDLPYTADNERIYFSFNAGQGVPDPFTPMGISVLQIMASATPFKRPPREFLAEAGKRLFIDLTDPARDPRLRHIILAILTRADLGAMQTMQGFYKEGRIPTRRILTPGYAIKIVFGLRRIIARVIRNMRDPEGAAPRVNAIAAQYFAQVQTHVRAANDLYTLLVTMEQDLPGVLSNVFVHMLPVIFPAVAAMTLADSWLTKWLKLPKGSGLVFMRSLPGNVTTEMDLRLWQTAQTIRADDTSRERMLTDDVNALIAAYRNQALPAVAQTAITEFLTKYGMRAVAEIDIGRARWREDPRSIFQTLTSYLKLTDPNLAPDLVYERNAREAERLRDEYVARLRRTPWGAIRANLLGGAIRRMRAMGGVRETPKFEGIKIFDLYRTALLEQGNRLVAQGKLERADDIFFVTYADLKAFAKGQALDLKAMVARQRADYEREQTRKQLPRLLSSTGEVFYEGVRSANPNDIVGDGVSPGVVEGNVRVVRDPRGVRLEPGEILVCPATDPGWTPLFLAAGGLVMEVGGMVTHGAVVAREYGIPAIVGVHNATTRLQTGQRVKVDGSAGVVTIVNGQQ